MDGQLWVQPWTTLADVRARLVAGVDPNASLSWATPLHAAAEYGTVEAVAELAGVVDDVDVEFEGRTALWGAVGAGKDENARALVAAGADPWRSMMGGWSPGRLSLAGRTPQLFGALPPGVPGLSAAETAEAVEAPRLIAALGDFTAEGISLSCVRGIDAAEAIRRLDATVTSEGAELEFDPDDDGPILRLAFTDVPGGCVVSQPWAFGASMPVVIRRLSMGTVCYGMYANPKSGNQGTFARDGAIEGWDLHPGGWPQADDSPEEILRSSLYRHDAVAYCCAFAGLRLTDARPFIGPPDTWATLPPGDYWAVGD